MKYFVFALLVCMAGSGWAQQALERKAREATDALAALYKLDEAQQQEMYRIQLRKYRNLQEIAPYKTSNRELYYQKLKAIHLGTDGSIKRMLRNEQMAVYYEQLRQRREREARLLKELRSRGASEQETQQALIEALEEALQG